MALAIRCCARFTSAGNVGITGYNTGLVVNEHTDGDAVSLYGNVHGASFAKANHASRFGRLGTYRNAYHLTVMGGHGFSVQQLAIENAGHDQTNPGNAWQALKQVPSAHPVHWPPPTASKPTIDLPSWFSFNNFNWVVSCAPFMFIRCWG